MRFPLRRLRVLGATVVVAGSIGLGSPAAQATEPFQVQATISVAHTSQVVVSGGYAFVASNSTITVIDTNSNTIVRNVPTGGVSSPAGAAAVGNRVFFAVSGSDQLMSLNTQTWTVSLTSTNRTGNVCDKPVNLFVVSDTRLVVDCESSNAVQIYDVTGTPSIVSTVAVGGSPRLMSGSGTVIFVPNFTANSVSVVDTAAATPTATNVSVGSRPNATAFLDGKIYVANFGNNSVTILNGAAPYSPIRTLAVGNEPQEIEPCAGNIYTANRWTGNTTVISPSTNTVVNTISVADVGATTHVMGVNGGYAYFLNYDRSSVSVVDCSTQTRVAVVSIAQNPLSIAFSQSAAYIAANNNAISVVSIPTTQVSGSAGAMGESRVETLSLANAASLSCVDTSVRGVQATWITLPNSDQCQVVGDVGRRLLGWSTSEDFPVEIARRQVDKGWGAYELFNADGRMTAVFIPAGGATFLSGSTTLYPILSP